MDAADRGRLISRLADLVEANAKELAALESFNSGKTINDAHGRHAGVANMLRYYAGWADKIEGRTVPVRGNFLSYTLRQPVGVVGQIIPWNFPLLMLAWKIGPGAGLRQHDRAQAGGTNAADGSAMGELADRGRLPGGRDQHDQRLWRDGRRGAVRTSRRRQDRLHRPRRYGQDNSKRDGRHAQADQLRTGGQKPERRLCRRRPGASGRRRISCHLLSWWSVLHRRQPAVCRGEDSRRVRRAPGGQGPQRTIGDPLDPATQQGPQVSASRWTRSWAMWPWGRSRAPSW